MSFVSAAVLLFLVMDPLGNIPLFLSALRQVPAQRQRPVILREMLIALFTLMLFLFLGGQMLRLLGLSQPALSAAGGIILMIIALRMVFPSRDHSLHEEVSAEPLIVPLAIPYIAGPSALATVLLLMSREPQRWLEWAGALLLAWALCLPIMLGAMRLRKVLGERGLTAIERLMGLILVTIAVDMLMTGVSQWWLLHK